MCEICVINSLQIQVSYVMIFVKTIVWLKTDTLPTENTEEEPCGQEAAVCRYFFSKMVYNNRQELIHLISCFFFVRFDLIC